MGRGIDMAKFALGMGALRAANTAARAAAWSSYPRYHAYPYGYNGYYDPYYYGGGYYGYGYGPSRGAGLFVAAVCFAIVGACCLLIPGIAGIICCGVGIAAALGFTIAGIVKGNSAPDTVVVKEESTPTQVEGKSPEQSQEQSQSQNKGNCAEKPRVVTPKENQMGIVRNGKSFEIKSNKKPEQMAQIKKQPECHANFAVKYKNKDNGTKQNVDNKQAKFNQRNLDKNLKQVIDMR